MKKLLLGLLLISFNAFAGLPVQAYINDQNTDGIEWYLAGLMNGFAFSNLRLQNTGGEPLYCPIKDKSISISETKKLINLKIQDYDENQRAELWIEPILLKELIFKYPCK